MADKEVNDLTDGGDAQDGDLVHVVRSGNSRKVALKAQASRNVPFTAATSSGPASLQFAEDTDNGSNKVTVQAPASLAADRTQTLPDKDGTFAMTSDIPAAASASEQETAGEAGKYVAPATQHRHPSAAKAWVNANGTGTVAIRSSYNVSSLTDTGTGVLTVNLSTACSSENAMCPVASGKFSDNDNDTSVHITCRTISASAFSMHGAGGGGLFDCEFMFAVVMGDQ